MEHCVKLLPVDPSVLVDVEHDKQPEVAIGRKPKPTPRCKWGNIDDSCEPIQELILCNRTGSAVIHLRKPSGHPGAGIIGSDVIPSFRIQLPPNLFGDTLVTISLRAPTAPLPLTPCLP